MNHSIRNIYTFRKKQKASTKPLQPNISNNYSPIPKHSLLQSLIQELKKKSMNTLKLRIPQIQNNRQMIPHCIPLISSKLLTPLKRANLDCENYRLIYRLNSKSCVVPCKVSLRKFKMNQQDLKFMEEFDTLKSQLQFKQPNEIDFLTPFNEFYQRINEIVLNRL